MARLFRPHVDEVKTERAEGHIKQGTHNFGRLAAAPVGGQSGDAGQSVDAALKTLNLFGWLFGLRFHTHTAVGAVYVARRPRSSQGNSSGGTKNGCGWRLPPILNSGLSRTS